MSASFESHRRRPRRSIFLVGFTSIAIALAGFVTPAKASDPIPVDETWQAAAEAASATPAELKTAVSDGSLDLVVVRDTNGVPSIETAHLSSRDELERTLTMLQRDPTFVSAESDSQMSILSQPPYFNSQWGITAVASSSVSSTTQGMNVTVAVIDSGVDASHPDLAGKVINGVDYRDGFSYLNETTNLIDNCVSYTNADYSGTGRTKPVHVDFGKYDPNGHGTHVAGIIASNGIGVKSVAPQAKIMPVRVMSEQGTGDMSDVACGIIYAANNGAQVINMSLGFEPSAIATVPDENAAIRAAVEYAISKNVVVVAATGNDGTTGVSFLPADLPNVIGVGAVYSSSGNSIASFSNRGNFVDVVAPGVGIWSTCSANPIYDVCTTSDGDSRYESLDGTSMATPFVSGLAALVLSMDGNLKNSDVASIITASAIDKGAVGYDQIYGYGLINAPAAITKAQEWTRQNTEKILAAQIKAAADAELARLAEVARLAEIERLATEKAAADKAAADKAAADKAAADAEAARVAAEKAAALSAMSKSLKVKALTKQRISILVTAPAGSRTIVQQKVGRIWKTVTSTSAIKSRVLKVSKLGYYRVQITSPNGTATSSIVRVK